MKDFPRDVQSLNQAIIDEGSIDTTGAPLNVIYRAYDELYEKGVESMSVAQCQILAGAAHLIRTHHLTNRQKTADAAYDKVFANIPDVADPEPSNPVEIPPEGLNPPIEDQ